MSKKLTFLLILFTLAISGCQPAQNNGFAIYLLSKDIPAAELTKMDINQLDLETRPILSSSDVISYQKTTHTIQLAPAALARVQQIFSTPVKVSGIPFVVCVGKERIYTGAFWTPLSSLSYDGVVIMQPFDPTQSSIQIGLGYPVQDFFSGDDPRTDPRIMDSLQQSQKLK